MDLSLALPIYKTWFFIGFAGVISLPEITRWAPSCRVVFPTLSPGEMIPNVQDAHIFSFVNLTGREEKLSRQETPNSVKNTMQRICEHPMCEPSMCDHSMCEHSTCEHDV